MFAVPGWSVSSKNLKTQTPDAPKPEAKSASSANDGEVSEEKSNKKRKRNGKSTPSAVNSTNVAGLYETVIEGKPKPKKEKSKKRQKTAEEKDDGGEAENDAAATPKDGTAKADGAAGTIAEDGEVAASKSEKKKRKNNAKKEQIENGTTSETPATAALISIPAPPKPVAQLTPLQASMRQKLISARFRHLNQTLYTTPSAHSLSLFQDNPEMFTEYHEGFRRQVEVWPENPVDGYIKEIKTRGAVKGLLRKSNEREPVEETPLPRTGGNCNIADLGCGDAALSTALQPFAKAMHLRIHSFDLQAPIPLITKADIANLPLKNDSIDLAIFCLALMGTNWVNFIEEAFRILRWKGELWIAEIKSRFGRVGKSKVVSHSVGNQRKNKQPVDKKAARRQEEEADDAVAAVEVDGHEDRNAETDVSAFVEVLRKRGFVLMGEGQGGETESIDLSNRMFVKMHFVKGATPIKGKCVPIPKGMEKMGMDTWKKKPKGKFIEEETEEHISSEAGVLKPCVYKLR